MKLIKKMQSVIEEANKKCVTEMRECETRRHAHLTQIGNILHPSVPISDNEVYANESTRCAYALVHSHKHLINLVCLH